MKFELKDFQEVAVADLAADLADAQRQIAERSKHQALVLSSPTGSGKTITVTALIERILHGGEGVEPDPRTVFLWISDSPELNEQSRSKIIAASDRIGYHKLITIDATFDEERLHPGYVYFVNTQRLGKEKLLTQPGDRRNWPFWKTLANTIEESGERFVLIIDEAHRGMQQSAQVRRQAQTIIQKFILGSEDDGLPPVPLIVGMSATTQRFDELLRQAAGNRTVRPTTIRPQEVVDSGLLKDLIVVHHPTARAPGDVTMLEAAASQLKQYNDHWENYCRKEKCDGVRPVLVVQVEDGTKSVLTRTNLAEAMRVIERGYGSSLPDDAFRHCFQESTPLDIGGRFVRKIEASRIQDTTSTRVVFFKMALTTGWDCPRAEVMMSYRAAKDHTLIAQLVGRMIRAPLARRIGSNDLLNSVELYLPHYDQDGLESILSELKNPSAEDGLPTDVATKAVAYERNPAFNDVFDLLKTFPNYFVSKTPKMQPVRRAVKLAGMGIVHGIDEDAKDELVKQLVEELNRRRKALAKDEADWSTKVQETGEIDVETTVVSTGTMKKTETTTRSIALNEENVDDIFQAAGRKIAPGSGLHLAYWKTRPDVDPNRGKLEFHALIRDGDTVAALEKQAEDWFHAKYDDWRPKIAKLTEAARQRFQKLLGAGGTPARIDWELADSILVKPCDDVWEHHLYCDSDGKFSGSLNQWEKAVLEEAMKDSSFVCWLRNEQRKPWALCVPYEQGGHKSFYPDFVVVRKQGDEFVVDLLEPHNTDFKDNWAKTKGLANFAKDHGDLFGRMEMIKREPSGALRRLNVNHPKVMPKAAKLTGDGGLEELYK